MDSSPEGSMRIELDASLPPSQRRLTKSTAVEWIYKVGDRSTKLWRRCLRYKRSRQSYKTSQCPLFANSQVSQPIQMSPYGKYSGTHGNDNSIRDASLTDLHSVTSEYPSSRLAVPAESRDETDTCSTGWKCTCCAHHVKLSEFEDLVKKLNSLQEEVLLIKSVVAASAHVKDQKVPTSNCPPPPPPPPPPLPMMPPPVTSHRSAPTSRCCSPDSTKKQESKPVVTVEDLKNVKLRKVSSASASDLRRPLKPGEVSTEMLRSVKLRPNSERYKGSLPRIPTRQTQLQTNDINSAVQSQNNLEDVLLRFLDEDRPRRVFSTEDLRQRVLRDSSAISALRQSKRGRRSFSPPGTPNDALI